MQSGKSTGDFQEIEFGRWRIRFAAMIQITAIKRANKNTCNSMQVFFVDPAGLEPATL